MNAYTIYYIQIAIMRISKEQLNSNIELVKWQHPPTLPFFNLSTVHSLLIDHNPKFIELKSLIEDYNRNCTAQKKESKLKLKQINNLYGMLCDLVRICNTQQQSCYLDKIYSWINHQKYCSDGTTTTRPTTASTRPFSAVSRVKSYSRPVQEPPHFIRDQPHIDNDKLKPSEKPFFLHHRTLHQQLPAPQKRLKEYQRKVFYEEETNSDEEIVHPIAKKKKAETLETFVEVKKEEKEEEEEEGVEEKEEINIDEIAGDIAGDIAGENEEPEEEIQEEDKFRPRRRPYADYQMEEGFENQKIIEGEINRNHLGRNGRERNTNEDRQMVVLEKDWAKNKSRVKSQLKRRAESARIYREKVGISSLKFKDIVKKQTKYAVIEAVTPMELGPKRARPNTAQIVNQSNKECIKMAMICGKLSSHRREEAYSIRSNISKISAVAPQPRKKSFAQILQQAEQKVKREAQDEIMEIKENATKIGVFIRTNNIAKSVTYYGNQLPQSQRFGGQITGMSLVRNPFMKVAKKKKKKKK